MLPWLDILLPPIKLSGAAAAAQVRWTPDAAGEYCGRCGATAAFSSMTESGCPHCRGKRIAWHGIWRLGAYTEPLADWIKAYKFQRMWAWGRWMGSALAQRVPEYEQAVVVPVPLHWRRRMHRGYDQAALLAEAFGRSRGLPVAHLLRRTKYTTQQSQIAAHTERWKNVRRAFTLRPVDLSGWTVWLIDDVKTSGATAHVCTRLLQRAGATRINVAVAAVADPRGVDFQRN